jgi:hypothetical protein
MIVPIAPSEEENLSEQFREAQRALAQLWDQNLLRNLQESLKQLAVSLGDRQKEIARTFDSIKSCRFNWPTFLEAIQNHASRISDELRASTVIMGHYGWYLDLSMTPKQIVEIGAGLLDEYVQEVECALIEYFEMHLDQIESSLVGDFPHRARLIQSAFRAHRREEYDLAIPVLLAQTDGICFDVATNSLFNIRSRRPMIAAYVDQIVTDTFRADLLSPLTTPLPINVSASERPLDFAGLNRHMVLHGEALDYGTKANSLRAISLINYIGGALKSEADRRGDAKKEHRHTQTGYSTSEGDRL